MCDAVRVAEKGVKQGWTWGTTWNCTVLGGAGGNGRNARNNSCLGITDHNSLTTPDDDPPPRPAAGVGGKPPGTQGGAVGTRTVLWSPGLRLPARPAPAGTAQSARLSPLRGAPPPGGRSRKGHLPWTLTSQVLDDLRESLQLWDWPWFGLTME